MAFAGLNYYLILSVERSASATEIKEAYRRLAKQYHPDKNGGTTEAKETFQQINEAHTVLSDDAKRRHYDTCLDAGVTYTESDGQAYDMNHGAGDFGGVPPIFEEFLNGFFGQASTGGGGFRAYNVHDPFDRSGGGTNGASGYHGRGSHGRESVQPIVVTATYTLEELCQGVTKKVGFTRQALCGACRGTGAQTESDIETCHDCKGSGKRLRMRQLGAGFIQQEIIVCDTCKGQGSSIRKRCGICSGKRIVQQKAAVEIILEPDMDASGRMEFPEVGNASIGGTKGSVVVELQEIPHKVYRRHPRRPYDLLTGVRIPLVCAVTEFEIVIPRLTGGSTTQHVAKVIKPDTTMRFPGLGIMHKDHVGDLIVRFEIIFPSQVNRSRFSPLAELLTDTETPLPRSASSGATGKTRQTPDTTLDATAAAASSQPHNITQIHPTSEFVARSALDPTDPIEDPDDHHHHRHHRQGGSNKANGSGGTLPRGKSSSTTSHTTTSTSTVNGNGASGSGLFNKLDEKLNFFGFGAETASSGNASAPINSNTIGRTETQPQGGGNGAGGGGESSMSGFGGGGWKGLFKNALRK